MQRAPRVGRGFGARVRGRGRCRRAAGAAAVLMPPPPAPQTPTPSSGASRPPSSAACSRTTAAAAAGCSSATRPRRASSGCRSRFPRSWRWWRTTARCAAAGWRGRRRTAAAASHSSLGQGPRLREPPNLGDGKAQHRRPRPRPRAAPLAAHHRVQKRARRGFHEDVQRALGGVALLPGARVRVQRVRARRTAAAHEHAPTVSSLTPRPCTPHLKPLPTLTPQATLDRIYKPGEVPHKRGLGWLNPVSAVGALQHRERPGAGGEGLGRDGSAGCPSRGPQPGYPCAPAQPGWLWAPAPRPVPTNPAPSFAPHPPGLSDIVSGHAPREASLVTLEQAVSPRVMPPGPLMRMVRGMCARTVSNMMADLQSEIERRRVEGGRRVGGHRCKGQGAAGGLVGWRMGAQGVGWVLRRGLPAQAGSHRPTLHAGPPAPPRLRGGPQGRKGRAAQGGGARPAAGGAAGGVPHGAHTRPAGRRGAAEHHDRAVTRLLSACAPQCPAFEPTAI
jgi:hypothetical protein